MAKAKDMREVPITWETREDTDKVLTPIINEVLGVTFDVELYTPGVDGVTLIINTRWDAAASVWHKSEYQWQGTAIKLCFRDWQFRTVHRTILIKPGEPLDANKLRTKWAEILQLKDEDDVARRQQSVAKQTEAEKIAQQRNELQLMGIREGSSQPFSGSLYVAAEGVNLEAKRLTANQVRAIVDILEG